MSGLDRERLQRAVERVSRELLAAIGPEDHWVGELSSSALSTATAVTALAVVQRESHLTSHSSLLTSGLAWLAAHQNADGGWGDTVLSLSNLSTTTLCWAAFGAVPGAEEEFSRTVRRAEEWMARPEVVGQASSLPPGLPAPDLILGRMPPQAGWKPAPLDALARAVIARYGKDRTFSVPILTMCALAGRLGSGRDAWKHVIPLPFELAACPHSWFAALRLPVVSYALPALIAIGQARHHHRPSLNPVARLVRHLTREATLRKLTTIQPENGGFLEATPLTSFVTMSLAGSGQVNHPVTKRGVEFLVASQRADGSWPIDTNLATWVTTLAVNALGKLETRNPKLETQLRSWLLSQQYRTIHPYTHAAPGGWAWTDLPGGVPDADDTAGALLALRKLGPIDDATRDAAFAGIKWLLDLQNRDGGIPTFCRGWGALPFDQSSADITAHAVRAWLAWWDLLPTATGMNERVRIAIVNALGFLFRAQHSDGSWTPLWFGNQFAPDEHNPVYGTGKVLVALTAPEIRIAWFLGGNGIQAVTRGTDWLLAAQNEDGSWGGVRGAVASVEETALAVEAIAAVLSKKPKSTDIAHERLSTAVARGTKWLIEKVESGEWTQPSPIGFYFAKLWYYEKLYPMIFTVGALNRVQSIKDCSEPKSSS
jgi:squalene-hopene/tetraprenyl-beta-curcumene cyclase